MQIRAQTVRKVIRLVFLTTPALSVGPLFFANFPLLLSYLGIILTLVAFGWFIVDLVHPNRMDIIFSRSDRVAIWSFVVVAATLLLAGHLGGIILYPNLDDRGLAFRLFLEDLWTIK